MTIGEELKEGELYENEAIKALTHAEDVLRKRIRAMKDGMPKWAANGRLLQLQEAQSVLKRWLLER